MLRFATPEEDTLVITYNDAKTTPAKIVEALKRGGIGVPSDPVIIR